MQKKRVYTLLLVLCLTISILIFPVSAATDTGAYGENLTWTFDTATKTLTFSGSGTLTGLPSDSGEAYMKYALEVRHIVVAEGITAVAANSFPRGVFYDVESIRIADSVTTIGNYAFANYFKLKQLHLGKGLKTIEEAAFMSCEKMESLTLPASLESIGMEAFSQCGISELIIPEGITVIQNSAFRCSANLTRVLIPASVTKVEYAAFKSCDKLTDVYYAGTKAQWESIAVDNTVDETGGSNADLLDATIHYNYTGSWQQETPDTQPNTSTQPIAPTQPTTPTEPTQPATQQTTRPEGEQNATTAPAESLKPAETDPVQTQPTEDTGGEEQPAGVPWVAIAIGVVVLLAIGGVIAWLCVKKRK